MKLLLLPLCLVFLSAPARDAVALRFEPEEGTVLKRTFQAEAKYHLADSSLSINGEAQEKTEETPDYHMSFLERIAVTDDLKKVADGRPTELVRTFDELTQNTDSVGDKESSSTYASPLAGRKVRFTWDPDAERYDVEAADDGELDEDVAAWLAEDLDLRLVLPSKEVEAGDEWELDPKLYLAFMWPSGLLDFHPEGQELDEADRAPSRQTIEHLEGSGTARLEEVREEDGVRVAVIHVELELKTGSASTLPAIEGQQPELEFEVEIERKVKGTILWDLEHAHARSATLDCDATRLTTRKGTVTGEDEDGEEASIEIEENSLLEGTIRYEATIERE
jgi:hypothetical protein